MSRSRCGAGDDDVSDASDLELLRRHEPILRFTDGELFFPMSTAPYVQACDLLTGPTLREARITISKTIADRVIMLDKRVKKIVAMGPPQELRDKSTNTWVRQFFNREASAEATG